MGISIPAAVAGISDLLGTAGSTLGGVLGTSAAADAGTAAATGLADAGTAGLADAGTLATTASGAAIPAGSTYIGAVGPAGFAAADSGLAGLAGTGFAGLGTGLAAADFASLPTGVGGSSANLSTVDTPLGGPQNAPWAQPDVLTGTGTATPGVPTGDPSLNPMNWTGYQIQDANTGANLGSGTFTNPVSTAVGPSAVPGTSAPVGGIGAPSAPANAAPVDVTSAAAQTPQVISSGSSFTPTPTNLANPAATAGNTVPGAPWSASVPTATPGAPAAATPNPLQQLMNDPLGTMGNSLAKTASNPLNLLGPLASAGGLIYSMEQGQKLSKEQQALEASAAQQAQQGNNLSQYLQNGTLPPGLQAEVAQATASAKAQILSGYASRGESTDPNQNSALAQELAAVDAQAAASQGQLAINLLNSGQTATGMSDQLYQQLVSIDQTQAQHMGTAISNFASSLAGRSNVPGITIQTGTV